MKQQHPLMTVLEGGNALAPDQVEAEWLAAWRGIAARAKKGSTASTPFIRAGTIFVVLRWMLALPLGFRASFIAEARTAAPADPSRVAERREQVL
ncbi:MAG: hypothetical protein Q8O56_04010 [Solirubrobacteraceae bacterium]|nr:hypothetical protein [Solirubrobacteraceae bacterium]